MNVQSVLSDDAATQLVRPLTDDEVYAVNGGILFIGAALAYIYNTAQSSTGGNSDISSWATA